MDNKSRKQIAKQYDELVEKYGFDMHSLYDKEARYDKAHQDFNL
jgi:hypothetical protein